MSFGDDRQMFDVDLDFAKCSAKITQLPFQPSGDRPVYCNECNKAHREQRRNNRPQRQMYDVNVQCGGCDTTITQLPFEPKGDSPVYCRDCFKKNRDNQ